MSNCTKLIDLNGCYGDKQDCFLIKMSDRFDLVLTPINVEIKNKAKQQFLTIQINISLSRLQGQLFIQKDLILKFAVQ